MLQFACDTCSTVKKNGEPWILGIAAEAIGVTSARREVTLLSSWDRERAVHRLAVHFCSFECKDAYMERLFGPDAAAVEVVVESTMPATKVVERRRPIVEERVITKVASRRRGTRKKSA